MEFLRRFTKKLSAAVTQTKSRDVNQLQLDDNCPDVD
jgi:hypothetical protein